MPDSLTIPKSTSSFPQYLDWSLLRAAGIKHIEELGSDLWTDYNLHDPGITILEVVCYALTDLGYRTNFDIKELLSRSHAVKNLEEKTIFGLPRDDNFFTAAEVLSCNPVTINDFRKLLIDVPGVRNAWLERAPEGEKAIYLNRKKKRLQYELPVNGQEELDRILLRGLYDICIELEPQLVRDACGNRFFSQEGILNKVHEALNAHRNLCEDFREIVVFGEEQIAICADIELAASANPEEVLLQIYLQMENFLSPTLPFYTLKEMLQQGIRVEDIFEGRPLSAQSHGFINPGDLSKLEPKKQLHASDIYRVIMDVEGVLAIRNLSMANAINNVPFTQGEKWCLELTPKYRPHFDLDHSGITFFKGVLPFTTNKTLVGQRYLEEKAANAKAFLDPYQLDLPIPEGKHHDLEDYTSIMEDFPLTYGIGEEGIKGSPDAKRKGQAKQLKGYLLFFDQLLANYLSQLAHVRDLFSMKPDEERTGNTRTYFAHLLKEVPGIEYLVKNFRECEGNDKDDLPPEDYPSYLLHIVESVETYQARRNRFLDHLLARFSESFADYVVLMFEINGKQLEGSKIIQDKADFLRSYPEISRNRGKGFDYSQPVNCEDAQKCDEAVVPEILKDVQPENISGLEKRVSKLIGINEAGRRKLSLGTIRETTSGWGFNIKKEAVEVLVSKPVWTSEEEACKALSDWSVYLGDERFYRRMAYDVAGEKVYVLTILDKNGDTLAMGLDQFPTQAGYCEAFDEYYSIINKVSEEKIELEITDDDAFFIVKGEAGEVLVRFRSVVRNVEEADLENFRLSVKSKEFYCRMDLTVPYNFEYGFILVNEAEVCIAESSRRFPDAEQREEVIHWLIDQVKLPGMECLAVQETECYEFQLFDYTGETLLFKSDQGFRTTGDAMDFFDSPEGEEDFMGWAVQSGNYEKTVKDGFHSFFLKNNNGEQIALHPLEYTTEQECSDRLQSIIYYLDDVPPVTRVSGTPGTFEFEITDAAGNILFKSVLAYPTQVDARAVSWLVRKLARHRVYYHLLEDNESDLPFGFELLDRNGSAISIHPQWYATDCERDLAVDVIIFCSENVDTQHQITEKKDGFYFELSNPDGTPLMTGLISYPDSISAEPAWEKFIERSMQKDNYRPLIIEGVEYPYGYELLDAEGTAIASFVLTYATEAESLMALRAVLNYVCHTEWLVELTGEPGVYQFWLESPGGKKLLNSVYEYPDEPSARLALHQVLQLAQDPVNFYSIDKYGFQLQDGEGKTMASHPHFYANESERNAAIHLVVYYVRNDAPRIEIPNIGGAFQAVMFGENGEMVFKGLTIHPNKENAFSEMAQLFLLAAYSENYQPFTDGNARCFYGFRLINDEGKVVARHPIQYQSAEERDKAMMSAFAWLTHGEILTDKVITSGAKFSFVLKDLSGQELLLAKYEYDNAEKAIEIWLLVVNAVYNPSSFITTYDNTRCLYSVELLVNEKVMALPPAPFSSRMAAREWIDRVALILKKQPLKGDANGTECGYFFQINHTWQDESDNDTEKFIDIKGLQHYPVPSDALKASHESAFLLKNVDFFKAIESDGKWRLSLTNENGEQKALSTVDYDDETEATEDRDRIQASLAGLMDLTCENTEQISTDFRIKAFYSQLNNKGKILLESHPVETEDMAWEISNTIHELSQDEKHFSLITNEEECLFSFELTDDEGITIASHPVYYTSGRERDESIRQIAHLVGSEGMHLVEHILLRPLQEGADQSFTFELFHTQQKTTMLQSASRFVEEDEARAAFVQMWVSLWRYGQGEPGYVVKIDDMEGLCSYSFTIMSEPEETGEDGLSSQVLALPVGSCNSAKDRDSLLENLVNIVKGLEEAPVEMPVLPAHYKAIINPLRLKDEVEGCLLMTPVLDHLAPGEIFPPAFSDPYSFRATVVLPYWPVNFRQPEFRSFIETTLRQEAPAHIFLRICWVNTLQMKEFEEAFCQWMATKSGGEDTCGAAAARNKLIKVLCSLRSIYPMASLHDCSLSSADSNRVVLNYSKIGSANTH